MRADPVLTVLAAGAVGALVGAVAGWVALGVTLFAVAFYVADNRPRPRRRTVG